LDTVYIDLSNYDEFRYASVLGNVPIYNNWSESFDFFIYIEESSPPKKIVYNELQKNEISENFIINGKVIRASSESRIQQISKSREVHDKNCNGDPC
jgi:hypothetical protein